MKNKILSISIVTIIFISSAVLYFYFFGRSSNITIGVPDKNNFIVGDSAKYIDFNSCDEYSKAVIEKLNVDKKQIHSCESQKGNDGDFYISQIDFGEAQDCPAGCFYETIIYKVSLDKKSIEEFNDGIELEEK